MKDKKTLNIGNNQKSFTVFIITAFFISWAIWLPLALNYLFQLDIPTIKYQHYYASFGPLIGAIFAIFLTEGLSGIKEWIRRLFSIRINKKIILISLLLPFSYLAIAAAIQFIITGQKIDWHTFGLTEKLSGFNIIETALIWMVTYGLGEEAGWRGFLLPKLMKGNSFMKSAVFTGILWILWHLPAFFFNPNYINIGLGIIGWAIGLMYGSIILGWICRESNWSIVPVVIWHGGFDLITAGDQSAALIAPVCSMLVILHGIYLSRKIAREEKNTTIKLL